MSYLHLKVHSVVSPLELSFGSPVQSVGVSPLELSVDSPVQSSVGSQLQDEGTAAHQINLSSLPYPPPLLPTGDHQAAAPLPAVLTALLESCSRHDLSTRKTHIIPDTWSGCANLPTPGAFVTTGDEDLFADSQPENRPNPSSQREALKEQIEVLALTPSSEHLTQWNVQTQEECLVEPPTSSNNSALDEQRRRAFGEFQALSQEVFGGVLSSFVVPPTAVNGDAYKLVREQLHTFNNSDLMLLINDIVHELSTRIN